jgi:GT2 family glycosyltransferase
MEQAGQAPRTSLEDLSVVIPTIGRPILRRSLDAIAEGSHWPARVIVVDQSASDEIAEWLAELATRGLETLHVPSSERGRALGVNRGIERVETRFLAITDDDCLVAPEWAERLACALRAHPDAVVTGRVDPAGAEDVAMVVDAPTAFVRTRPSLRFDPMSGGNMGAARSTFERVGLFEEDPRILFAEDGEWAYRALRRGVPLRYEPDVAVAHHGWRDATERQHQYANYARSQGAFYGKFIRRGDGFILLRAGLHLLRATLRWLRGSWSGDAEQARVGRAYAIHLLPGVGSMFRARPPA